LDVGGVHAMKDPTRGGTAVALNEIASKSQLELEIQESQIPIRPAVQSLCDVLGLNPLHMSSEGKFVMAADSSCTDDILATLRKHESTKDAKVVGKFRKVIQVPYGEPVPRVC
ncbi:MAG: AIR synthase-related protein, partial [Candidatus Thorarchaeota archaeon]